VLLHEVEHFETFDHTLLLAYLPSLLHVIDENQAPGITRIIHSIQNFASHRSIILERTADNGSLKGLLEFGFPPGVFSKALRSTFKAMKDAPVTLIEVMIESGVLEGPAPTADSPLFPSHPDAETRIALAADMESLLQTGAITKRTFPFDKFNDLELRRVLDLGY
jgi:hypothetical protein